MSNRLTVEIVNELDFGRVIYMEDTDPGGMGNVGGVVLEVFDGKDLVRYETTIDSDAVARSATLGKLKANREQYDHYYGGAGNEVYLRKGARIAVDEQNSRFVLEREGQLFPFYSSVIGIFRKVARSLSGATPTRS